MITTIPVISTTTSFDKLINEEFKKIGFTPRNNQVAIISTILDAFINKRHKNVILNASTGVGKSIIAYITSRVMYRLLEVRSIITMNNNILVDQYINTFAKFPGVAYLKGAENYRCNLISDYLKNTTTCKHCNLELAKQLKLYDRVCSNCIWKSLKNKFESSKIAITNYSYWLSSAIKNLNFAIRLNIYDECHTINSAFSSTFDCTLTNTTLNRILSDIKNFIKLSDNLSSSIAYDILYADISSTYNNLLLRLQTYNNENINENINDILFKYINWLDNLIDICLLYVKEKTSIEIDRNCNYRVIGDMVSDKKVLDCVNTARKLCHMLDNYIDVAFNCIQRTFEYIIENIDENIQEKNKTIRTYGFKVRLVFVKDLWSKLTSETKYNLFLSATINPTYMENMLTLNGSTVFIKAEPVFPKEHKTLVYYKSRDLSYTALSNPTVINSVKNDCLRIISAYKNNKGIILTPSFSLNKDICDFLKNNNIRVYEHIQGEKLEHLIGSFKNEILPSVLVSPSLWEGIDLPDEQSRFQILIKAPFASMADNVVKYIIHNYPEMYRVQTLLRIIQGFGRSIRSKDDYAVTFILDNQSKMLLRSCQNIWADEFSYQEVS